MTQSKTMPHGIASEQEVVPVDEYEKGYRDGGNSTYQDWVVVLNEFTPLSDDFEITPDSIAALIREMAELLQRVAGAAWPTDEVISEQELAEWRMLGPDVRALLRRIRGESDAR